MEVREHCIYRVPSRIRDVKPEAYTPQMVVIGPLHRSSKSTAKDGAETSSNPRSNPWTLNKEYMKMEDRKKKYLESFTQRVGIGKDTIEEMRKTIQAEEENIRASYEEQADWIASEYSVELILLDSVFIMEFVLKLSSNPQKITSSYASTVNHDLILLENQLPYFLLDKLFSSRMGVLYNDHETLAELILIFFGLKMKEKRKFKHFTDMFRCVYEESLGDIPNQMKEDPRNWPPIRALRNAENLSQAGVDFKLSLEESEAVDNYIQTFHQKTSFEGRSLHVEFVKGSLTLTMPAFHANEETDMYLRNVIAFEQCHDAVIPFTSNYIYFLNFLITSKRDVQLLSEAGMVTNTMGRSSLVLDMVNKLQVGVKAGNSSQYHNAAKDLMKPCIYRVPSRIRNLKPEAYTPQMVVIGPLHRSPKSTAKDGAETSSNHFPWHLEKQYTKIEDRKQKYLQSFTQRVGEETIQEMRKIIQAEEKNIRASYEEQADRIASEYYVELILLDSVFIMEFVLKLSSNTTMITSSSASTIRHDLILLENQLPYFIFDSLFGSRMGVLYGHETLDEVILSFFGLKIEEKRNFKHFTDMFRCVYEESLGDIPKQQMKEASWNWPPIKELRNADNLSQAGVDFKIFNKRLFEIVDQSMLNFSLFQSSLEENEAIRDLRNADKLSQEGVDFKSSLEFPKQEESVVEERKFLKDSERRGVTKSVEGRSLHVKFEEGSLTMPALFADEVSDMYLRNVIAFEQCHDAVIPFTSNYIYFLNFLITSDRDVQLLSEAGVVMNSMGRPSYVVGMVKKLQLRLNVANSSQYHYVAMDIKAHYKSRRKMYWATLRKVYFNDLWTGTATLGAVLLLFLTLVGTVASVIQAF